MQNEYEIAEIINQIPVDLGVEVVVSDILQSGFSATDLFVQPDITQHKLKAGDFLILCSDGLWSVIEDDEFANIVNDSSSSVAEISQNLIDLALAHHTDDNVSLVVLSLRKFSPVFVEQEQHPEESLGWFKKLRKFVS